MAIGGLLKTYDIKNVQVFVNGVPLFGFAPDSKVSITQDNESYSHQMDCDGLLSVRSKNNDGVATVTVKLMHGSEANGILQSYRTLDKLTNLGTFSLNIVEINGGTVVNSIQAYIIKDPDINFDKEVPTKEWQIRVPFPDIIQLS
jgi:hypothetical protein